MLSNIKKQAIKNLEGAYWRVWLNLYPYLEGNLMIIPKRHINSIKGLTNEEWKEFHTALVKTQDALTTIYKTKDFNVALNTGKKSGASIKHMHWQVVPRPFMRIENSLSIFADLHIITQDPKILKKRLESL